MSQNSKNEMSVLLLDGVSGKLPSYVTCGTSSDFAFAGNEPYTLTARACFRDSYLDGILMGKILEPYPDGRGDTQGYMIRPESDGNFMAYRSSDPYRCEVMGVIEIGKWVHIIVVFDGSAYKVYIDGELKRTLGGFKPMEPAAPPDSEFMIGTACNGRVGNLVESGMPKNWLIQNMSVISTQVPGDNVHKVQHAHDVKHDYPLVALWDFTTGTAQDLSGNGHDGKLMGTAKIIKIPSAG